MSHQLELRTWIVEGSLLACTYPAETAEWQALSDLGIVRIICLHETPHSPDTLANWQMTQVHLPTPDFTPPSPDQLQAGVAEIQEAMEAGEPVAVHCRAGLGRTGTLLAAWLTTQGHTPDEAIARIRQLRPGSVETAGQEAAVAKFAEQYR